MKVRFINYFLDESQIKPSVFDPSPRVSYISMSSREDPDLSTCTTSIACVEQVHRAFN